ncbi:MAG: hypothetical protein ABIO92_08040 [Chloroflexia bacterium]
MVQPSVYHLYADALKGTFRRAATSSPAKTRCGYAVTHTQSVVVRLLGKHRWVNQFVEPSLYLRVRQGGRLGLGAWE